MKRRMSKTGNNGRTSSKQPNGDDNRITVVKKMKYRSYGPELHSSSADMVNVILGW